MNTVFKKHFAENPSSSKAIHFRIAKLVGLNESKVCKSFSVETSKAISEMSEEEYSTNEIIHVGDVQSINEGELTS